MEVTMKFRGSLYALMFAVSGALLIAVTACGGGGGGGGGGAALPILPVVGAPPTTTPPATGQTESASIKSARTGATYDLQIYLPPSYAGGSAAFPVIYALDGDALNPPVSRFQNLKEILERRRVEAILIGIGGTARRSTDYTFPGALPYHEFLTAELVPFIESRYRSDAGRRILTGLSLSGSMTGHALFLEGASGTLTFSHFLSFEGSYGFQKDNTYSLEQKMYDAQQGKTLKATLILARCSDTSACNYVPVGDIYEKLLQRAYAGFTLVDKIYSTSHVATDLPAFEDAISMIFE